MNIEINNVKSDKECSRDIKGLYVEEINKDKLIHDNIDYHSQSIIFLENTVGRLSVDNEYNEILNDFTKKSYSCTQSLDEVMKSDESSKNNEPFCIYFDNINYKNKSILENCICFIVFIMYRNNIGETIGKYINYSNNIKSEYDQFYISNMSYIAFLTILNIHVFYFTNIISLEVFCIFLFLFIFIIYILLFSIKISELITVQEKEMCNFDSKLIWVVILLFLIFDYIIHVYLEYYKNIIN